MSWSYLPRWKLTDSCGRPRVPGGIHVGCTHDAHTQQGHATRRALLKAEQERGPKTGSRLSTASAAFGEWGDKILHTIN